MKTALLLLILSLTARADVPGISLEDCTKGCVFIVDATVESFNADGSANLKVHAVLKGEHPPLVVKRYVECTRPTMQDMTSAGSRYVLFILAGGESVRLKYDIRDVDGKMECLEFCLDTSTYKWTSLESAKQRIAKAILGKAMP